jgi:hypothetical protein
MMSWTWQMHAGSPAQPVPAPESVAQPADGFPSQADAESWVGEVWRELLDEGVDSVSLFEEGRLVYGPMSLHPAQ